MVREVKPGQIYADNDVRHPYYPDVRYLEVIHLDRSRKKAICEVINSGRETIISVHRLLKDTRRGYRFVANSRTEWMCNQFRRIEDV